MLDTSAIPPFVPLPWLVGGHAQTIAGAYWPLRLPVERTVQCVVPLSDGDALMIHDDCPASWQAGDPIVVLVHGLAGSHQSPYVRRLASKLVQQGLRAVRLDLRGAGAGLPLARLPYHSGRSDDVRAVVEFLSNHSPGSPVIVVGFSLGGNIVLKFLGEVGDQPCGHLVSGMAVCPPIDLQAGSDMLGRLTNRIYDRHFVRILRHQLRERLRVRPDAAMTVFPQEPRRLRELDEYFTAPLAGYRSADEYYERCSSQLVIDRIGVPTWIIAAHDDPIIPVEPFTRLSENELLRLTVTRHGGHLGFIGRRGIDPDRHWIDWRVIDWVRAARRVEKSKADPSVVTIT